MAWHYPGTPYMGIGAVFSELGQAQIWGVNPLTLVSGGVVAWALLVLTVFFLGWRVFGPGVRPGVSATDLCLDRGTLALGRITGGHLLIVAWSRSPGCWCIGVARWRRTNAAVLGLWCGLGLYLDSMFAMTLLGVSLAGLPAASEDRKQAEQREGEDHRGAGSAPRVGGIEVLVLAVAFLLGATPRWIGTWVDPYDSYNEQFAASLGSGLLVGHLRILFLDCLPRLVAGHRIPGLQADPELALLGNQPACSRMQPERRDGPASGPCDSLLGVFAAAL